MHLHYGFSLAGKLSDNDLDKTIFNLLYYQTIPNNTGAEKAPVRRGARFTYFVS